MTTVQELAAVGKEMGLQEGELKEFVKEQQTLARAERQAKRDAQE